MESQPQANAPFCWYCKRTFSYDVTYKHHLADYHKMAQDTISEITTSGDVNRARGEEPTNPTAASQEDVSVEGSSTGTMRPTQPTEMHDSEIEIIPGIHRSLPNEMSSSESEMPEDVKPAGLKLHEALDTDARFNDWLQGTCKYQCGVEGCGKIFNTSIRFWNHVEKDAGHNMSYMRYREEHPGEYCVEKNKILCMLCQKRVEHDRGKLLRHFRKLHPGGDIKDYYRTYVERGKNGESAEEMVVEPDLQLSGAASDSTVTDNRDAATSDGRDLGGQSTARAGVKRRPDSTTDEGQSPKRPALPLPSTSGILPLPSTSESRTEETVAGGVRVRDLGQLRDNSKVPGVTERQKRLSPLKPLDTNASSNGVTHDYDAGGHDPLNACEFACPFCSWIYKTSWLTFRDHLKKHSVDWDKEPYRYTKSKLMTKVVYHNCVLCGEALKAEVQYVTSHIHDKHHKMKISEYRSLSGCYKGQRI